MLTKLQFDESSQPYLPPNTYYGYIEEILDTDADTLAVILKITSPEYPAKIKLTKKLPNFTSHRDNIHFLLDLTLTDKGWPIRYLHNSRDVLYAM